MGGGNGQNRESGTTTPNTQNTWNDDPQAVVVSQASSFQHSSVEEARYPSRPKDTHTHVHKNDVHRR